MEQDLSECLTAPMLDWHPIFVMHTGSDAYMVRDDPDSMQLENHGVARWGHT